MEEKDNILVFIYNRMIQVHKEDGNSDYMIDFKKEIKRIDDNERMHKTPKHDPNFTKEKCH